MPQVSPQLPCWALLAFLPQASLLTRPRVMRHPSSPKHTMTRPCRAAYASADTSPPATKSDAGIDSISRATRFRDCFAPFIIPTSVGTSQSPATLEPLLLPDAISGRTVSPIPLELVSTSEWATYLSLQDDTTRVWLSAHGDPPTSPAIPVPNFVGKDANIARLIVPIKPTGPALWRAASVYAVLPKGMSYTVTRPAGLTETQLELGWALAAYSFTRYRTKPADASPILATLARVTKDASPERADVDRALSATYMVRDMISTPAEDFGPANLEAAALALSAKHGASTISVVGTQLLGHGYPQVHRVGRAANGARAPRLIELVWNDSADKTVTLVGKGVCYDTGGLSIKPTNSMVTMKKDMGGAAQVLGLAHMVMDAGLNVRLRVLIPAVENCIDSSSYRPGDVLTARNGTTTLNMNSDAEGRLVLADALVAATEEAPDLIIDCATLTGAQRVAMGPEVPSIFCDDDAIADRVFAISRDIDDLVWRLPLHAPYRKMLDTPLADIKSCSSGGLGGAITAALYLKEFVGDSKWIHVDMMGYNTTSSPGRPEGGEAMGMRALFECLRERYGTR